MKVKEAFKIIMADEELRGKFNKNPVGALKEQGVDTDNLPPEVLEKIAGAGSAEASAAEKVAGEAVGVVAVSISSV